MADWNIDKKQREDKMNKTILDYETQITELKACFESKQCEHQQLIKEKEEEIERAIQARADIEKENQKLDMTLRIPRMHMEFLKEKGKLDEFVDAKLKGDELLAKWLLLDAGKDDIDRIAKRNSQKIEMMQK